MNVSSKTVRMFTCSAVLFVLATMGAQASRSGSLTGTVVDSATHAAIAGALVKAGSASATTTSTGSYKLSVSSGTYTASASATNYTTGSQTVTVYGGKTTTANFALAAVAPPPPPIISAPGSTLPYNGTSTYWLGADYAWYNYGTDFGTGGWGKYTDWTAINTDFANMHTQGVHIARWWVFADGRYSPDFNSDGTVLGLDSYVLPNIDQALQIAATNHIRLLLTVVDGSIWGSASYSGSVQMGGHAALVTSSTVQQSFLDNALKPLLLHIAGSANKSAVAAYDIVNEPEAQMSAYWGGSNLSTAAVQAFVQNCTNYIHTYSGGAYATVGSAAPSYVSTWKNLGLDFYQIHYYPWMDNGKGAGAGLPTYAALSLDKPCIVGEFPTADSSYGLYDTNGDSARWYLDTIYNDGYAGALGWSYRGGDSASNWASFNPVYTYWNSLHSSYVGPN